MDIGVPTSFIVSGFTLAVAAGLLLLSWSQHRQTTALALWGAAFAMGAVAALLIAERNRIPDIWSIVLANAVLAGAYGMMWNGARRFEGRSPSVVAGMAGLVAWLMACALPIFYATPTARAVLMTSIGMAYTLLTVHEFWRARSVGLMSRWPVIVLLTLHAAALPTRIPLVSSLTGTEPAQTNLLTFVLFETVLLSMAGAYLFVSLVKESIASTYQKAASVDPLTGVANRRAFLQQGGDVVQHASIERRPVALLLFDLDRFKTINDAHGHAAGDLVLMDFCAIATAQLRPTDLFARLGGEEFACLLPDTTIANAIAIGERIRRAFAAAVYDAGGTPFAATVSIGLASVAAEQCDLSSLLVSADRALYRAKSEGRDRMIAGENYGFGSGEPIAQSRSKAPLGLG
jgi:diguanylate cyclase (GGDEF)-like protein